MLTVFPFSQTDTTNISLKAHLFFGMFDASEAFALVALGGRHTFQGKNPASQSIHDGQQGHLVRHVEEVVLRGCAGDRPDFVGELLDFRFAFVLPIVVAQNLKRPEKRNL